MKEEMKNSIYAVLYLIDFLGNIDFLTMDGDKTNQLREVLLASMKEEKQAAAREVGANEIRKEEIKKSIYSILNLIDFLETLDFLTVDFDKVNQFREVLFARIKEEKEQPVAKQEAQANSEKTASQRGESSNFMNMWFNYFENYGKADMPHLTEEKEDEEWFDYKKTPEQAGTGQNKPILIEDYLEKKGEREFMFSKEELQKIDEMSIADYVLSQGFHIKKTGKDYKIEELSGGCYIDIEKNQWKWWNRDKGGKIITFVMELEGKNWVEAVKTLLNMNLSPSERMMFADADKEKAFFALPKSKKNINANAPKRAFAYLVQTRKIDPEIVSELMKQGLIYEDGKSNVVFVGKDKAGKPHYAFLRGTYTDKRYMGEVFGSEKSYSFSIPGKNKTLYVMESAIDVLSYQTLLKKHNCIEERKNSHFLSLGGVSMTALNRYLKDYAIEEIICCLDNDEAGKEATEKIIKQYGGDYSIKCHLPKAKDFNMQLTNEVEEELAQEESIEKAHDMEMEM